MTSKRFNELMSNEEGGLTVEEIQLGWHFCWEWDGLLVDPGSGEWGDNEVCRCGYKCPPSLENRPKF